MNTQKIRVFLAAMETGSMTKAGEKLGYTQSAVTQMMQSFETEVGFPLLTKSHRGVTVTKEGEQMLPVMRQILTDEEKMNQEIAAIRGLQKGTLRIGSFISTSVHWMPTILTKFQRFYPDIQIQVEEGGQGDIENALEARKIDVGLLSRTAKTEAMSFIPLQKDPIVLAFSEKYDLSHYDRVPLKAVEDYPFVLTELTYDQDVRVVIDEAGIRPKVRYSSKDDYAVLSMVRAGLGIAVLPELVIQGFLPEGVQYRKLNPEAWRTLGIAIRSPEDAGPIVKTFIRFMKEEF